MNMHIFNQHFAENFWLQTAVLVVLTGCADCRRGEVRLVNDCVRLPLPSDGPKSSGPRC